MTDELSDPKGPPILSRLHLLVATARVVLYTAPASPPDTRPSPYTKYDLFFCQSRRDSAAKIRKKKNIVAGYRISGPL